jgi:hypothetical protein
MENAGIAGGFRWQLEGYEDGQSPEADRHCKPVQDEIQKRLRETRDSIPKSLEILPELTAQWDWHTRMKEEAKALFWNSGDLSSRSSGSSVRNRTYERACRSMGFHPKEQGITSSNCEFGTEPCKRWSEITQRSKRISETKRTSRNIWTTGLRRLRRDQK